MNRSDVRRPAAAGAQLVNKRRGGMPEREGRGREASIVVPGDVLAVVSATAAMARMVRSFATGTVV